MRFRQLDQITELTPGVNLTAQRTLSDSEAYLSDHFPNFRVMPGVLMLEAMSQACNWLVRKTDEFANSVVVLKEALNIKFAGFVRPGQTLTVTAAIKSHAQHLTTLTAKAEVGGSTVAGGRIVLERFNLADRYPLRAACDTYLRKTMRAEFESLQAGAPGNAPVSPSHFRWMWIDRFTDLVEGKRAVAVKNVTVGEEPMDLYMPRFPVMPCSLIVEGLAQTGGILVNASHDFAQRVVLAKVGKAVFYRPAVPGDTLVYTADIESLQPQGAMVHGTSHIGGELHAEIDLFFAFLDDRMIAAELIEPAEMLATLRMFGIYDVARKQDGSPLPIPRRFLEAERAADQES
jgi:3-hydroxyacyl-[acyl-carrier-protein] dehydratase